MKQFRLIELKADMLDDILNSTGIDEVDLVSITTYGSDKEILHGMKSSMMKGLPNICLAKTGTDYLEMMIDDLPSSRSDSKNHQIEIK